jgi:hypothetical protein
MNAVESRGSFLNDPGLSEKAVVDALYRIADQVMPDEQSQITRRFTLQLDSVFENKGLYRSKNAFSAVFRHDIGDDVTIKFGIDPAWHTAIAKELEFSLLSTRDVRAVALYDSEAGQYFTELQDKDGASFVRDPIDPTVIEEFIANLGVPSRIDTSSQQAFSQWCQPTSLNETHQTVTQSHLIYEKEYDDTLTFSYYLEIEQSVSPEEIVKTVRFIESASSDTNSSARITSVFSSTTGEVLSIEEVAQTIDQQGDTTNTRHQVEIDSEGIEKVLRRLRNVEVFLPTEAQP